ncbi:MAG: hypothetical protein V1720_22630 [bacterium]
MYKFLLLFLLPLISVLAQEFPIENSPYANAPDEIKKRKSFQRERWFNEQRMYPNNYIPKDAYENALRQKEELRSAKGFYYNRNGESLSFEPWTNIGPTPGYYPSYTNISSRIPTVQYDPQNPNIIYIGAAYGGVWKSTDGGSTWAAKTDNEESLSSGAIAIDPVNTNIIYYGTGEATYSGASYYGRGLLKSTDSGETWTNIKSGLPSSSYFSRIVIDPSNTNSIFAALGYDGLYHSSDAGLNWSKILTGRCDDVVCTTSGDTLYAVGNGVGYAYSVNSGANFSTSSALSMGTRNHIAICKATPNVLYFAKYSGSSVTVYKSTNSGSSFTQVSSSTDFNGGQAWYDFYIHVNPLNSNYAYVGTIDVYRTTNGGTSFSNITNGYSGGTVHVDQHNVAFHPTDQNQMLCANDGGIWKSTNKGTSWTNLNSTLTLTQFYRIASDPSDPNHVMGGTQDNGTQRTQGTLNWAAAFGGDGGEVCFHPVNPDYILGETQNNGVMRSSNGGSSWSNAQSGLSGSGAWVGPIIAHPTDAGIFYTARGQVFKTTNWGASWSSISSGTSGTISQLAISTKSPNIIYASSGSNIYKSTNNGTSFTLVKNGLPNSTITSIFVHPDSSGIVFVTFSGFSASQKIYRSINGAQNWVNISGDLPNSPANDVLILPQTGSATLYFIATDVGVFVSENYGTSWIELADGLPNTVAMHLDYNPTSREIFIGTHGRGVFKINAPSSTLNRTVSVNNGWNIISVPLETTDMSVTTLFPNAVSDAFNYNGTYNSVTNLENGKGYWLKFDASENISVSGHTNNQNITINEGWNIVGPFHEAIPVSNITTNPVGILSSDFYSYDGAYVSATQLDYGKGYWIKADSDGELILNMAAQQSSSESQQPTNKKIGALVELPIIASDGISSYEINLYAGFDPSATEGIDKVLGEPILPPSAPGFDARFIISYQSNNNQSYRDYKYGVIGTNGEFAHRLEYQLESGSKGLTLEFTLPAGVTMNISDLTGGTIINQTFGEGKSAFSNPLSASMNGLNITLKYDGSQMNNKLISFQQ